MKNKTANQSDKQTCPQEAGTSLTYNSYLKVDELKSLQCLRSSPAHHDEMLFIIIHQAYELWFKQILHELELVFQLLAENKVWRATFYLKRVVAILKLLVQQIHLLETMSARDFLGFRYNLNPASGFQSSQFREIEFICGLKDERMLAHFQSDPAAYEKLKQRYAAPSLGEAFYSLLNLRGFSLPALPGTSNQVDLHKFQPILRQQDTGEPCQEEEKRQEMRIAELLKIYNDPETYGELYDLAETLFDIDECIFLWRTHHVTVVERMIGFKRGTGGSEGVAYLRSTMTKRCFPDLWKLRTYLEQ